MSNLIGLRINKKFINIDELKPYDLLNITDNSGKIVNKFKGNEKVVDVILCSMQFKFKNDKIESILIESSDERIEGIVKFVDDQGYEICMQSKYNLYNMVYSNMHMNIVGGISVDDNRIVDDYDNTICNVMRSGTGFYITYEIK